MSDGEGSDSEDYPSIRDSDSEDEESGSSGNEVCRNMERKKVL